MRVRFPSSAPNTMIQFIIEKLPNRFKWTIHNLIAHPLSELLYQIGAEDLGNKVHDATLPTNFEGDGRG